MKLPRVVSHVNSDIHTEC